MTYRSKHLVSTYAASSRLTMRRLKKLCWGLSSADRAIMPSWRVARPTSAFLIRCKSMLEMWAVAPRTLLKRTLWYHYGLSIVYDLLREMPKRKISPQWASHLQLKVCPERCLVNTYPCLQCLTKIRHSLTLNSSKRRKVWIPLSVWNPKVSMIWTLLLCKTSATQ